MTNEEKANEILDDNYYVTIAEKNAAYNASLQMAAWKEQQMIDRAKEFISTWFYEHPHTSWLICSDEFQDLDDCLERLEKEMTEENNDDN